MLYVVCILGVSRINLHPPAAPRYVTMCLLFMSVTVVDISTCFFYNHLIMATATPMHIDR